MSFDKDRPKYASLSANQWFSRSGIPKPPLRGCWQQTCLGAISLRPLQIRGSTDKQGRRTWCTPPPCSLRKPPSNPGNYLGIYLGLYFWPFRSSWRLGFALIKVDLGPCYLLVPHNHLLHSFYVQTAGHIVSAYADTFAERGPAKRMPRRARLAFSSLSLEKRRYETTPPGSNARSRKPPSAFRSPAPLLEGCGTSC